MSKLIDLHGNMTLEPAMETIRAAFEEVLEHPVDEDGYTCIRIESGTGWQLVSYGTVLMVLEHTDGQDKLPRHLADLDRDAALGVVQCFAGGGDVSGYDWKIGYGPS